MKWLRGFKTYASSRNVVATLEQRGLVANLTSRNLRHHVEKPQTVYLGVDPSARSLHVGNLVALIALLHFQLEGHNVIALIGGATGSVGDPSGRSTERNALPANVLQNNVESITAQMSRFFEEGLSFAQSRQNVRSGQAGTLQVANNLEWFGEMRLLDFLGGVGKGARVSTMLARESVKSRLSSASGISFTEFSYNLLQAYDFHTLRHKYNCTIQLGGSDQLGNIMAGIEMINKEDASQSSSDDKSAAYGLTLPLLTTASGQKFGKSAGNAVWLAEDLTSPYELYQFFMRTLDADIERYLKIFTFLPLERISEVINMHQASPADRSAQRLLAEEVTALLHGSAGLKQAEMATNILFGSLSDSALSTKDVLAALSPPTLVRMPKSALLDVSVSRLLVSSGLAVSATQARQLLTTGGLSLNHHKVADAQKIMTLGDLIDGRYAVLRAGKANYRVIVLDETMH